MYIVVYKSKKAENIREWRMVELIINALVYSL
jgi:hypothetical protein